MLRRLAMSVPKIRRLWDERDDLIKAHAEVSRDRDRILKERDALDQKYQSGSPFFHYTSCFDALAIIRWYARHDLSPSPDHVTNFLGVKVAPDVCPTILADLKGTVEDIPIPANWHADIAEWAATLRAVDFSNHTFRIIELGCGWGCWLNNTGAAARSKGLKVELIGVEGDPGHAAFARRSMADNGFSDNEYRIVNGVAAATKGMALFPVEEAGATWSSAPILNATREQIREAANTGRYHAMEMFSLSEIATGKPVDLLHIDIQGGEADFIDATLDELNVLVRYLVVGTHSRQIEGRIIQALSDAGWAIEMERAAIFSIDDGELRIVVDGVQGWRNPALF